MVGSSVTLNCAGTNLKWDEFVSDDKGPDSISSGSTNYAPKKYDVVTTPKERYDLTIKSLALTDGGKYRCKVIRGATAYAEVIVFTSRTMFVVIILTYLGLLRFFLTIGGVLGGQIFNFPLECSTTSWQGSFVVVEKLLCTPMSI